MRRNGDAYNNYWLWFIIYYIYHLLNILHAESHLIFTVMETEECVIIIQILQMRK